MEVQTCAATLENNIAVSQIISKNPTILLLGKYPKDAPPNHKDTCSTMYRRDLLGELGWVEMGTWQIRLEDGGGGEYWKKWLEGEGILESGINLIQENFSQIYKDDPS